MRAILALAIREDLGTLGDWTTRALVAENAVGRAGIVARQPGVVAGLPGVEMTLAAVEPRLRWSPQTNDGRPVARRRVRRHDRGARPGTVGRRTDCAQPAGPAVGHRHSDAAVRRGRGRHEGPHLRHPQDHARLAAAGEVRRPLRRRLEPPRRARPGRAHQRQPSGGRGTGWQPVLRAAKRGGN